ncbi:MAG: metal ABC transporter permease [Flavobacteriales bacterium]|nr:metal ABC transporter permease [Bacteroidota bacterium]MCB9241019.1 metal ABC transporter permease [Flavobacteriales bacterium]
MTFIREIISFFTFSEPNVKVVFLGSLILCAISGLVGTFTFLRKRSLIGDVISHAVLPGIALAFIIGHQKNVLYLIIGATITGWISTYLVEYITRHSKIKSDTAIALILSVFFGIGVLLLTHIQHTGAGSQSGLDQFIFGRASAMNQSDIVLFGSVGIVILVLTLIFFRGFSILSFDEGYANAIGFPIAWLKLILSIITVITVAMGVQAVGVVLMSALLITPAAAARFWTNKIHILAILAVLFASISGIIGSAVSYTYNGMPTGPWIVVIVSLLAFLSAIIGSKTGILKSWNLRRRNNVKILKENTIKLFYALNSEQPDNSGFQFSEIAENARMENTTLRSGLKLLRKEGWLIGNDRQGYQTTEEGKREARAIVRKHRLWELYISKYMHLQPDHVHDDAEGIEHVITPEIERELEEQLDFPKLDPHNSEIPY